MKSIIIGAESDLGLHVDGTNLAASFNKRT